MPKPFLAIFILLISLSFPAKAEFMVSSAIVEFTPATPHQKDIEVISVSPTDDYLATEVYELTNPGKPDEKRQLIEDTAKSKLLVTPNKTILQGKSRKVMRFVLLTEPDEKEHIYRVVIKPVINELENTDKIGLKILVGYEVLVIIRPKEISSDYKITRAGNKLTATNNGNSNILLQSGRQCQNTECKAPPITRIYPGTTEVIELPFSTAVEYSVWDGKTNKDVKF